MLWLRNDPVDTSAETARKLYSPDEEWKPTGNAYMNDGKGFFGSWNVSVFIELSKVTKKEVQGATQFFIRLRWRKLRILDLVQCQKLQYLRNLEKTIPLGETAFHEQQTAVIRERLGGLV